MAAEADPVPKHLFDRLQASLRCPACHSTLGAEPELRCDGCGVLYPVEEGIYRMVPKDGGDRRAELFYNAVPGERYGRDKREMPAQFARPVLNLVSTLPGNSLMLEIGSGRGAFDRVAPGYVAFDLSFPALSRHSSGLRVQGDAQALPFADGCFDAVFTVAALEHVPEPERALGEIDRILRPGGIALIYPAWYVKPWVGRAVEQRGGVWPARMRALNRRLRDRREYQFLARFPGRLSTEIELLRGRPIAFRYRRLEPNLAQYVTSDSDAFSSMDPHAASAYFVSRGYSDLARETPIRRLLYRYEPVTVRKPL